MAKWGVLVPIFFVYAMMLFFGQRSPGASIPARPHLGSCGWLQVLVVLKGEYPSADISSIVTKRPKVLLQPIKQLQDDAAEVRGVRGAGCLAARRFWAHKGSSTWGCQCGTHR